MHIWITLEVASSAHQKLFFFQFLAEREVREKDDTFHLSLDEFTELAGFLLLHGNPVILQQLGNTSSRPHNFLSSHFKRESASPRQNFAIALWQKSNVYVLLTEAYVHLLYYQCSQGKISLILDPQKKYFTLFVKRAFVSQKPKFCLVPREESYPEELVPSEVERCKQHQIQAPHHF